MLKATAGALGLVVAGGLLKQERNSVSQRERSFLMVKPEGVQRGLVGEVISRLEERGLKLVGLRMVMPDEDHYNSHYAEHRGKPFYPGLLSYMASGPVVAMVWEGEEVVSVTRTMLGRTDPRDSKAGPSGPTWACRWAGLCVTGLTLSRPLRGKSDFGLERKISLTDLLIRAST